MNKEKQIFISFKKNLDLILKYCCINIYFYINKIISMSKRLKKPKKRPVSVRMTEEQYHMLCDFSKKKNITKSESLISSFVTSASNDMRTVNSTNPEAAEYFRKQNQQTFEYAKNVADGYGFAFIAGIALYKIIF